MPPIRYGPTPYHYASSKVDHLLADQMSPVTCPQPFSLARFYTISFNFHLFSLCYTLAVAVIVLHCAIVWHVRGQSLALCYFQLNKYLTSSRKSDRITHCEGNKYRWGIKISRFSTNQSLYLTDDTG